MSDVSSSAATSSAKETGEAPHRPKAKGPFGALYNWVIGLAGGKYAEPSLFGIAFAESSFFPIPPDVMLAPMCFARPERAYRYALVCTIASILGAMLGYAIGFYLFEGIGSAILGFFGQGASGEELRKSYGGQPEEFFSPAFWVIMAKGATPIPFKLVTIISGWAKMNFLAFLVACTITRVIRFLLVAFLFKTFGPTLAPIIEKRVGLFMLLFVVVLVGGFFALSLLHH